MEYKRLERFAEAKSVFAELITRHPSYVASYLMAGQVLIKLGERKAAYELYEQGITAAKQANDEHAKQELMAAQAELE